jgi:hypothetical protein
MKSIDGWEWKLLMTNRIAVRGDIRSDDLKAVGAFSESFLDAVHADLKGDLTDIRLSIRVFGNEEEFRQWASCRETEASEWFYDSRGHEVALLFGPSTDINRFCGNLMRGVVHVYVDRAGGGLTADSPALAERFADYEVLKGRVVVRKAGDDIRMEPSR